MRENQYAHVYCFNNYYYITPIGETVYSDQDIFAEAIPVAENAPVEVIGDTLLKILSVYGKQLPGEKFDEGDFQRRFEPFKNIAHVKSYNIFVAKSKLIGVQKDGEGVYFTPTEYHRGSFGEMPELAIKLPADVSLAGIGDAIGKAMLLCIGKNS